MNTAEENPDERPVDPAKLFALIKKADRIVVAESSLDDEKVIFSSSNLKDITEFADALRVVVPEDWFHCPCFDSPVVRLYRGDTELAVITNHQGRSVSCSLWSGDALVSDPEKWLKWFDARKLHQPRKEYEETNARAKQYEASEARWRAAMPRSIRPLWPYAANQQVSPDLSPLRAALAREFSEISNRILAILTWYGSGDGRWSGYPAYEQIAEELLLDFSTGEIVSAVESSNLTEAQLEGTARLFGGWSFSHRRPNDLQEVPAALKRILLEHSLKSADDDKRGRAEHAFKKP
jgi:hypothetical protein